MIWLIYCIIFCFVDTCWPGNGELQVIVVCSCQQAMQVPPVSVRRVGRCKSASAADIQFHSRWHLRNCRHERVPVTSCSENAASKWSQKLPTRLSLASDADEAMCIRHQHNCESRSCSLAPRCMPSGPMSSHTASSFHTECHCVACCSCSPFDRRSGNCPAFTFPMRVLSARRAQSVDSGLALCRSCSQRLSADRDSSCTNEADLVQNSVASDAVIHKSSSVPACCSSQMRYYAAGISFDSLNDDTCRAHTIGLDSASSNPSPVCSDAKSESPVSPSDSQTSPAVDYMNNQVSPVEYHNRLEVCTFATDVSKCTLFWIIIICIIYIISYCLSLLFVLLIKFVYFLFLICILLENVLMTICCMALKTAYCYLFSGI